MFGGRCAGTKTRHGADKTIDQPAVVENSKFKRVAGDQSDRPVAAE
jgi:hypothetical protein